MNDVLISSNQLFIHLSTTPSTHEFLYVDQSMVHWYMVETHENDDHFHATVSSQLLERFIHFLERFHRTHTDLSWKTRRPMKFDQKVLLFYWRSILEEGATKTQTFALSTETSNVGCLQRTMIHHSGNWKALKNVTHRYNHTLTGHPPILHSARC